MKGLGALIVQALSKSSKIFTGPIGLILSFILERVLGAISEYVKAKIEETKAKREERRSIEEARVAYQNAKSPEEKERAFKEFLRRSDRIG
jgi:hypothetical protein